jgi:hypothetical protein
MSPSPLHHSNSAAFGQGQTSEATPSTSNTSVPTPVTVERHGGHEKRGAEEDADGDAPIATKVARTNSSTSDSSSTVPNPPSSIGSGMVDRQGIRRIAEDDES